MYKRILVALVALVSALGIGAAATTAVWSDTVTVTNNVINTGNVNLMVSAANYPTPNPASFNSTTAASTMVLNNLAPSLTQTGAYSFSLRNDSSAGITLNLTGQVTSTSITPNGGVDKTKLWIQLWNLTAGIAATTEITLADWETLPADAFGSIAAGATQDYEIRARLDPSADNTWQGQQVLFTLSVTGTQP